MKVLFVTGLTGFGIGGARTEEIRLVRGAADKGCDVAMCSDVLAGELNGIAHFRLDYPPGEKAPAQLTQALNNFRPDLVHVVGGGVRFLRFCDQRITDDIPWIFTAHNVPPAERIFPRLYGNARLHYAIRNLMALPNVWTWYRFLKTARFRTVICHSQTVASRLRAVGCPPEKIVEIPFGSELPESALHPAPQIPSEAPAGPPSRDGVSQPDPQTASPFPADAWPKIVTVAGLAHHKGQLDAVRMAARLVADFPKLSYRLIGMTRDKKYRAYLEKTIAKLGLAKHVCILHSAPEPLKFAALREADLYIQPSHEEGFCIAFLEAAMLSPRVIGANTGAIAAMAQGDATSRVVHPGDVRALESAARDLLREKAAEGAVEARRTRLVGRYSWDGYLKAHLGAYRSICKQP